MANNTNNESELGKVEFDHTTPSAQSNETKRTSTKRGGAGRNETSRTEHVIDGNKPTPAKTKRGGQKRNDQGHELDHTATTRSAPAIEPLSSDLGQVGLRHDDLEHDDVVSYAEGRFKELPQSAREMISRQSASYAARDNHVKVARKPRNVNEQLTLAANEGPTADILGASIEVFNLPKIDIHDEQQVRQRLSEFFTIYAKRGLKPTVVSMGMALGLDRRRLWEIKSGAPSTNDSVRLMPANVRGCIKEAYDIMESLWESYMLAGKINPVTGIFLAKNNWGYVDRMDHVVAPGTEEQVRSADDIRKNYLPSADSIETEIE